MGSSKKPAKTTDRPIIQTLRKKAGGSGSGGGGAQQTLDLNAVCVESFSVRLRPNAILRIGATLNINGKGDILLAGTVVGALNAQQFRRIVQCKEEGYDYVGKVVKKEPDKHFYGHFKRRTI